MINFPKISGKINEEIAALIQSTQAFLSGLSVSSSQQLDVPKPYSYQRIELRSVLCRSLQSLRPGIG